MITQAEKTALMQSSEFKEKVVELKDKDLSFKEIAKQLSDEFDAKFSSQNISQFYTTQIGMELTREGPAEKQLNPFLKKIEKRFGRLEETTNKYHAIVDRTIDGLSESEDFELTTMIKDVLHAGKQVETVSKMTLAQIQLIQAEQDKLKITANKGIRSDAEIRERVDKHFKDILNVLAKQGKIKIIDTKLIK